MIQLIITLQELYLVMIRIHRVSLYTQILVRCSLVIYLTTERVLIGILKLAKEDLYMQNQVSMEILPSSMLLQCIQAASKTSTCSVTSIQNAFQISNPPELQLREEIKIPYHNYWMEPWSNMLITPISTSKICQTH